MDINGCHIVSKVDANSPDGFSSMVSRYVGVKRLTDGIPDGAVKVDRGPFDQIVDAIKYAKSWSDAANPPPLPGESNDPPNLPPSIDAPANTPPAGLEGTGQ